MPIANKIDGVWRDLWSAHANINGVWRDLDSWSNINGVWRENFKHNYEESDIIGFRMVYRLLKDASHSRYPNLHHNIEIPVVVKLTGDTIGKVDSNTKGIVFKYTNEKYEQQGLLIYRGDLYAMLGDGQLINVGMSISEAASDKRVPGNIPGITEAWCTNKLAHLFIQMNAHVSYESYGYFMDGWNSLFNTTQFLDLSNYPDKGPHKNRYEMNSYDILPIEERVSTFDSAAYIGIARDMTSSTNNMIGSYGTLDHNISSISVNGVEKPFVIELYN